MGAAGARCKERAEIVDEGTLLETHIAPRASSRPVAKAMIPTYVFFLFAKRHDNNLYYH